MKSLIIYILAINLIFTFAITQRNEYDIILNKFKDSHPKELFKVYHSIFNKHTEYDLNSEEGIRRYKVFKANLLENKKKNEELGAEIYGITQFTDLTQDEFVDKHLMKPKYRTQIDNTHKNEFTLKAVNPSGIDWTPNMGPVKDQKRCGCCWAFATLGAIEGNYNINFGGDKLDLSEQYQVNCDYVDNGCNGGTFKFAMSWIENNGVLMETDSPFIGVDSVCTSDSKEKALNIGAGTVDFIDSPVGNSDKLIELLNKGPLYVAVDATDLPNYKPYNNEPWVPKSCSQKNHAVIAVGYEIVDGEIILNIRNSWNTTWGINGYFKVNIKNSCGITTHAYLPKVKQNVPFPSPNCLRVSDQEDMKGNIYSTCQGVKDFKNVISGNLVSYQNNFSDDLLYFNQLPNCLGKGASVKSKIMSDIRKYINVRKWYTENDQIPEIAPTGPASIYTSTKTIGERIIFYDEPCYSGKYFSIRLNNISDLSNQKININNIKSIAFSEYYSYENGKLIGFTLHEEINYTGKSFSFNKSYPNLDEILSNNPDIFKNAKSLTISNLK